MADRGKHSIVLQRYNPHQRDRPLRILLVEDAPAAAQMLAKGLREQGYAVDIAMDGEDGAFKASVNQYDLIVLDVMLPRKDGFSVCRELRASGLPIQILMLTARDTVEDRIAGLDHGADDYLTKPLSTVNCWRACGRCCGAVLWHIPK
jgi:two-component system copper resistance phosphate regulon response regulator CusR